MHSIAGIQMYMTLSVPLPSTNPPYSPLKGEI